MIGAQFDVDRHRRDVQSLQSKIAAESSKVASARERDSEARQQAAKVLLALFKKQQTPGV
ncbi:MAG: hypothetical protein WD627_08555 [Actinomycetota bacterium]